MTQKQTIAPQDFTVLALLLLAVVTHVIFVARAGIGLSTLCYHKHRVPSPMGGENRTIALILPIESSRTQPAS